MMKQNRSFILLIVVLWHHTMTKAATSSLSVPQSERKIEAQITQTSFPGLHKINDDLYVGKVADTFYLAMERVTPENIEMWQAYAKRQKTAGERMSLTHLRSVDGSAHFQLVLDEYKSGNINNDNALWIAYASNVPVTKRAKLQTIQMEKIEILTLKCLLR